MNLQDRIRQLRLDPPHRQVARAAKVLVSTRFGRNLGVSSLPDVLRVALEHGISVVSMHAIHAQGFPDRVAIVDERRELTYEELNRAINQTAHTFQSRYRIKKGSAVVMMMRNRVEYIIAWFALFRLGARGAHASFDATPEELTYLLGHSGATLVLTDDKTVGTALEASKGIDASVLCMDEGKGARYFWDQIGGQPDSFPERSGEAVGENIVYTSGTTGKPKGALRDFARVDLGEGMRILERLPLRAGDRHLVVGRLYHSGAQAFAMLNTALGATIYMRPTFKAEDTLRALSEHDINSVFLVPTMIARLLELPEEVFERYPTPNLRAIVSGAGAFPHALRRRAIRRFGVGKIFDFYGATELGWITLANGYEMMLRPGTVGRCLNGHELRVVDERGRPLTEREVGVIEVRNSHMMDGYLNNEKATHEVMRNGWLTVEDTGFLDESGYLFLSGRARDMIVSGGVNIYPVEIEERLAQHPDVKEVAVVGTPSEEWGEVVTAFVVLRDGRELDETELKTWVKMHLSRFKVPRVWRELDVLPRNPTGKVLKRDLREM